MKIFNVFEGFLTVIIVALVSSLMIVLFIFIEVNMLQERKQLEIKTREDVNYKCIDTISYGVKIQG